MVDSLCFRAVLFVSDCRMVAGALYFYPYRGCPKVVLVAFLGLYGCRQKDTENKQAHNVVYRTDGGVNGHVCSFLCVKLSFAK